MRYAIAPLVLALLAACAPAAGAPRPAPAPAAQAAAAEGVTLQALVEAARQEGQLSLVWGEGTLGGGDGVRRLAEGFNRYYGLHIDVRFTPGPTMSAVAGTVAQETQAGRRATTDVYVGYDRHIATLSRLGALLAEDWASWAPNIRDPALVAPGGVAVTFQSAVPGIAYHSGRLPGDAVPRSMQALLEPRYKGRLATSVGASSFDRLATPAMWGRERLLAYTHRLAEQVAGLIRCNEVAERLLSGEFDVFALTCSQSDAFAAMARGAPIGYVIASDAPLIMYLYLAVPRTAVHPHAAKLWINYVLSREAQDLLYEMNYADSHLLPGSRTAQDIARLEATGYHFLLSNVEFIQAHDEEELARVLQEVVQVLRVQR